MVTAIYLGFIMKKSNTPLTIRKIEDDLQEIMGGLHSAFKMHLSTSSDSIDCCGASGQRNCLSSDH